MDTSHASLDLLAHFDGPLARETTVSPRTRGVGWVLKWFAAAATLLIVACTLAQFGYCLAAELSLARAARAGVLEATRPRATHHSVAESVARRLPTHPRRTLEQLRLELRQNGAPVRGVIRAAGGDVLRVEISVPVRDVLPDWLRMLRFWPTGARIEVRADRQAPGRRLVAR